MYLSGISVTVDDCLDPDKGGENVFKKAVSIGHSHATKSDVRLDQYISHLLFNSIMSIHIKTS